MWGVGREQEIAKLAARQHGVFNRRQARAAGFDYSAIQRRVAARRWVQLDHSVYGLRSAASSWERQVWAAYLSRTRAIVGGASAAYLHGLRGFRPKRPVIVVPGSSNTRSDLARVIRAEHFEEIKTARMAGGLPVSTVPETLVCLAADLPPYRVESVLDDCLLSGKVAVSNLEAVLERESGRRRRGIVFLRELIEERASTAPNVGSSYLEGMLEAALSSATLPPWVREHPFTVSESPARADVFVPQWRLVIEADGRNWHARVDDFETDRARDNDLATQGIQVLRFTYKMLTAEPEACLETIMQTGAVRSA